MAALTRFIYDPNWKPKNMMITELPRSKKDLRAGSRLPNRMPKAKGRIKDRIGR